MKSFKEIETSTKFINIMSIIMLTFSIIFGLGCILLFIYAIASCIAFDSLIPTVIFGASFVCTGLSASCFGYFFRNKIKKEQPDNKETKVDKVTTWSVLKEYLTFANFGLAFVIIGAVLFFSSIGLGSLKRTSWYNAAATFKADNGYYTQSAYINISYNINAVISIDGEISQLDIDKIDINLENKHAVVIYSDSIDYVKIIGFELYTGEITLNNVKEGTLYLEETNSPRKGEALDNMFWFIFNGNAVEKQLEIYIPTKFKDAITLSGKYTIAK